MNQNVAVGLQAKHRTNWQRIPYRLSDTSHMTRERKREIATTSQETPNTPGTPFTAVTSASWIATFRIEPFRLRFRTSWVDAGVATNRGCETTAVTMSA